MKKIKISSQVQEKIYKGLLAKEFCKSKDKITKKINYMKKKNH